MSSPKISINIVTYNSARYLPECLKSISKQTFEDFSVLVIDNGSKDETTQILKQVQDDIKSRFSLETINNKKNLGFSGAHNQGINWAIKHNAEYVLVTNPDIILEPGFLEETMRVIERDDKIGSVGGKLLKFHLETILPAGCMSCPAATGCQSGAIPDKDHAKEQGVLTKVIKTDILDSTGLKILKNRRIVERGANEQDSGQYDKQEEVFGVSGALGLYGIKALENVALPKLGMEPPYQACPYGSGDLGQALGSRNVKEAKAPISDKHPGPTQSTGRQAATIPVEYFDEDFFAYKEDVDLAWRLRLAGWKSLYVPGAVAYHARAVGEKGRGYHDIIQSRRDRSEFASYHSYKNHLFLLIKNEFISNLLRDFLVIKWFELRKLVYLLVFERSTLKALGEVFKKLPQMRKKRKLIMKRKKVDAKTMRQWFT